MRNVLRDGRFRLLLAGETASMFGDWVILLALAIWVKDLTGSNSAAGAVTLTFAAPTLLAPALGVLVDRVRRRPFLIWANLGSAVMVLPLLAVHDRDDVWIVYAVGLLYGVSFILLGAGLTGLVKEIVPTGQLAEANAALRTVREGLRLVGPLVGAGLYTVVGPEALVVIDAASFLLAAVVLLALRVREKRPVPTEQHLRAEAAAGFRHLFGVPSLRHSAFGMAAALLALGLIESGVFAYVDQGLDRPPAFVGVLVTAMGVGSVGGGLLAAPLIRRTGEMAAVAIGLAAMSAALTVGAVPMLALAFVAMPIFGAGVTVALVGFATLTQRRTPQALIGRVSTVTNLVIGVPQTTSIALGAALVAVVDYRLMFLAASAGVLVAAAGLWRVREPADAVTPDEAPAPDAPSPAQSSDSSAPNHPENEPSERSGCHR